MRTPHREALTPKQTAFVQAYADPTVPTGAAAARRAGYVNPRKLANRLLHNPKVQRRLSALQAALQHRDITLDRLAQKLGESLEADKTLVLQGGTETVPDHPTRLEAIKTGFKLHGHLLAKPDTGPKVIQLIYGHRVSLTTVVPPPTPAEPDAG